MIKSIKTALKPAPFTIIENEETVPSEDDVGYSKILAGPSIKFRISTSPANTQLISSKVRPRRPV